MIKTQEQIKQIRRTYILARALNVQLQFIKDFINEDLRDSINQARAKNNYFIKQIDNRLEIKNHIKQIEQDEELAFKLLEQIEQL